MTEISLFPSIRLGEEEDISVSWNSEQNYCKVKGLRSCPCLVQMRELDFNNRSDFTMNIELACAKFWCLF